VKLTEGTPLRDAYHELMEAESPSEPVLGSDSDVKSQRIQTLEKYIGNVQRASRRAIADSQDVDHPKYGIIQESEDVQSVGSIPLDV